jgi:hypothetical protein
MVIVFPALSVLALATVAWWFLLSGRSWSDPAVTPAWRPGQAESC